MNNSYHARGLWPTFVWSILRASRTAISAGQRGLLVIQGQPTDQVPLPGTNWVPSLRKRQATPGR